MMRSSSNSSVHDQSLPMAWDKADWKVWTHPDGDSWAMEEVVADGVIFGRIACFGKST